MKLPKPLLLMALTAGSIALFEFAACSGDDGPAIYLAHEFGTTLKVKDQFGTEKTDFTPAEAIVFELSITNITGSPKTLTLSSSQTYEIIGAVTGTTQPAWHVPVNAGVLPVIVKLSFSAGETKVYQETWDQTDEDGSPVSTGEYNVQGYMLTPQEAANFAITGKTDTRSSPVSLRIQ